VKWNANHIKNILTSEKIENPPVIPILVYPKWLVQESTQSDHVWVLNPAYLKWRIPNRPHILNAQQISHINSVIKYIAKS
jgi:hypothetical protein